MEIKLKAPAKINLSLDVRGRRPDGYHELATVMQTVDLYDTITLTDNDSGDDVPCAIYRKGQDLVKFFNKLGSNEIYESGFPSRWKYTDEKLRQINGTPEIDKCIKMAFAPVSFRGRINELDALITYFNETLQFDKWQVVREEDVIRLKKLIR